MVPALIYSLDRDAATIAMVDSNLHREKILPSEKAFAYKLKLDAMQRQGQRTDLTSDQVGRKLETAEIIGELSGDSKTQVRRYIRLTELIPDILRMVDDPDVIEPIRFLREREVVHFQRFGEALRIVQDSLNSKNFYAINPEFDLRPQPR